RRRRPTPASIRRGEACLALPGSPGRCREVQPLLWRFAGSGPADERMAGVHVVDVGLVGGAVVGQSERVLVAIAQRQVDGLQESNLVLANLVRVLGPGDGETAEQVAGPV